MKIKPISLLSILTIITLLVSCKNESQRFSELLASKDIVKAYKFQSKYSKSRFNIDSLIQSIEYHLLLNTKSTQGFRDFLVKHRYGLLRDSVIGQLSELEWTRITGGKTYWDKDALDKFYDEFDKSSHCREIEDWRFENQMSGTFTDVREGRIYKWKKIGNQIWMVDRLKYKKNVEDERFGLNELSYACPKGWHIPSMIEWIKAIENSTNKPFNDMISLQGQQFFTTACQQFYGEISWSFWTRPNSGSDWITSFSVYNNGSSGIPIYYVRFNNRIFDKLLVLCVKDSKTNDISTSYENSLKDISGTEYRTVKIGNLIWMNDDLTTTKFSNGELIPTTSAMNICNENKPIYQWDGPNDRFGRFYTCFAVNDNRGVCPDGWRIPTAEEWKESLKIVSESIDKSKVIILYYSGIKSCNNNTNLWSNYLGGYWTSDQTAIMLGSNDKAFVEKVPLTYGLSVKCVK